MADRALVEVLSEDGVPACDDCGRLIGLPSAASSWPISFGIVAPPSGKAPRVRVRLYRAARVGADGMPSASTTIDRIAKLPPARGNTDVAFVLSAECVGVPANLRDATSCNDSSRDLVEESVLALGRPDSTTAPGTWSRSQRRPCATEPEDDMVCVPGGFFVMGEPSSLLQLGLAATPERFVSVAPFILDRNEVTVGAVRQLVKSGAIALEPVSRGADPTTAESQCTYLGTTTPTNDDLPVNCVDHSLAAKICEALGKRLPTEAEWEWAAGNLEEKSLYPWGNEGDPCFYADVGLGSVTLDFPTSTFCLSLPGRWTSPAGVPRVGNARDRTELGIVALAGDVSEWVADNAATYDSPCWHPEEPFLDDPECKDGERYVVRGSSWLDAPGLARISGRQSAAEKFTHPSIGLRCARSE